MSEVLKQLNLEFAVERVQIVDLHKHPRNYRNHPPDQIEHIIESIRENGLYRNIVIANDDTILAGHGVVKALKEMGVEEVPVIRVDLPHNDPKALKIMVGDNEISHLGEIDDRLLTDILKDIRDIDEKGLFGTGFDEQMLANLVYITRPKSEIDSFDAAAHWVGMPDYDIVEPPLKMVVNFRNPEDRIEFVKRLGVQTTEKTKSIWWPPKEREDPSSLIFE